MARFTTSLKPYAFTWDFNFDGGAIGAISTGLFIPAGTIIVINEISTRVSVTGAPGNAFEIGIPGDPNALSGVQGSIPFNPVGAILNVIPSFRQPLLFAATTEIIFTISVAPLTGGLLLITMMGQEPLP